MKMNQKSGGQETEKRRRADLELADLQLEGLLGFCSHVGHLP